MKFLVTAYGTIAQATRFEVDAPDEATAEQIGWDAAKSNRTPDGKQLEWDGDDFEVDGVEVEAADRRSDAETGVFDHDESDQT